jgi:hypothetical protein
LLPCKESHRFISSSFLGCNKPLPAAASLYDLRYNVGEDLKEEIGSWWHEEGYKERYEKAELKRRNCKKKTRWW